MTKEELKNKCKERAKIFQQAMECCKSSSPMDCIEWFADRIAELEKENAELQEKLKHRNCVDCSNHGINIKLIKAKEIIRKLINACCSYGATGRVTAEAEQFLNSEVEK